MPKKSRIPNLPNPTSKGPLDPEISFSSFLEQEPFVERKTRIDRKFAKKMKNHIENREHIQILENMKLEREKVKHQKVKQVFEKKNYTLNIFARDSYKYFWVEMTGEISPLRIIFLNEIKGAGLMVMSDSRKNK